MKFRKTSTQLFAAALTATLLGLLSANWRSTRVVAEQEQLASVDPQMETLRLLQADSQTPLRVSFKNGFPRSVTARVQTEGSDAVERASFFLRRYRGLFAQNSPQLALKVRHVNQAPDEDVLFYQTYRGLEVFGAGLLVSLNRDKVFHAGGALMTAGVTLDPTPLISEETAIATARRGLERETARLVAPTKLFVFDRSLLDSNATPEPHLAWRVVLGPTSDANHVFVDAHTGRVLLMLPSTYDTGSPLHGLDLDMQDAEDEANAQDDNCYWGSDDVTVADEDDFNSDYNNDPDAVQGFAHIKGIYAFFHETFNRHSYDDDFSQVELFIHSTTSGTAQWSSSCELIQVETGKVSFDILGHEFTHAVIGDTSQLIYALQSGALNESYADILGVVADQQREAAQGKSTDWLIGEDKTGGGGAIRNLSDPTKSGQPDHFSELLPPEADPDGTPPPPCPPALNIIAGKCNDFGWVHLNSGISNKTAFLMADGGTHPDNGLPVVGMGRNKMRDLKWRAATHLVPFADFAFAAGYEIAVAENWAQDGTSGFNAANACTVKNAWAAVGLGKPDSDCDGIDNSIDPDPDGDFIPTGPDNCPSIPNPLQQNTDGDSQGDVCDTDDDNDGVPDVNDNCPTIFNPPIPGAGQPSCDDLDGDDVSDTRDNCVGDFNPMQIDSDGDGEGDVCEVDTDTDGISNDSDNCPTVDNTDQANADGDSFGDACDLCPHTKEPNPAFKPNGMPFQPDSDGDGTPDACDPSILYDGRTVVFGAIQPDGRFREAEVEARPATVQRMPLVICARDCPEWFAQNDRVVLRLKGLDESTRVWVTDEDGNSVKKATGPTRHRKIEFKPIAGRIYYLTFTFRESEHRAERDVFRMKLSTKHF